MPSVPTVDSLDAATALIAYLGLFSAGAQLRGAEYHRSGRVVSIGATDARTVAGQVRGERLYTVELIRTGQRWTSTCSCPLTGQCKHVFALGREWLARLDSGATRALAPEPAPAVTFRQRWEPILAQKLGRPLTGDEGAFLSRLAQAFQHFRQSGSLRPYDVEQLGFRISATRLGRDHAYAGGWDVPPRDALELWHYIACEIEAAGLAWPEFMRPITDTGPIRARMQDRQRREVVNRWTERFAHLADHADTSATPDAAAPEPLDLRLRLGSDRWTLETRTTPDAPWKSAPRSFLDRFVRDDDAALARIEASPAVYAFLALCQKHYRTHFSIELSPTGVAAPALLHRLLSHPLARAQVVNAAGQPLAFAGAPLAWALARSAESASDYEFTLRFSDGAPVPAAALHLPGRPDFYVHNGTVYRGPPALDGRSAAGAIVPAEAVERPETLQWLHQLGATLPPEIATRFVTVPLRARIECALENDEFSGVEFLVLQLRAVSEQPPVQRTWAHGWSPPPAVDRDAAATAGPAKIYAFDLSAPQAATARLAELNVGYDELRRRWSRRVTRSFPDEFLAWRAALPPEIEVLATGELASLLGAPVRARIDFELVETTAHRDWFDLALALKPEDTTLTPDEIALLLRARGKLVRLPGKGWRRLQVDLEETSAAALAAAGFDRERIAEAALGGERQRFHALQLAHGALAELLPQRQAEALRQRARELTAPTPPELPATLRAELRPYQREGFHFLAFLSANRLGGVLADDMGLGKTVQTLAWLLWLVEQRGAAPRIASSGKAGAAPAAPFRALVVCPKSVVGNWESEAARFAPTLATVRFAPGRSAAALRQTGGPVIVLANYTQLRLHAALFQAQHWHAVVLDEGQFIKTPGSKVAQVARELPGDHRVVLTGTPIENRLLDLWSLFAFALPGLLGGQTSFKRHYAEDDPLALARLRARVRHFLLRRTKAQVASDLPARTEEDVLVDLEGPQAKLYQAELKRARAELLKVDTPRQFDRARFNLLASLLRLRQICCHPALVDPAHRDAPSAKLDELLERLEELRDEGHQVLVFSQFVMMLELIRDRLVVAGIEHLMLTGQTENRDELVRRFQTEPRHTVFLLSLKAAGFGLNLTAASYVVLYDPWWNPAVEAQAIDRTHRIGQTAPVNAYRLLARGTIEEKIRALQREKAALAASVVAEESLASTLDLDSLRKILA